jgi:flagellar biosynthesis/type III secretory pathway protein FliH
LSDAPVSYAFEQLEPSEAPPRDASARMLAQAREEAERIRELARAEGYDEGRTNGLDLGAAEIASAAGAFAHAVQGIESLRTEVLDGLETDAIELGIALAGKILAGAFQARPELVVEVVQGALRRIADRRKITVVVNPADVEAVRAAIGGLTAQGSGVEVCDLQSDERVGAGSAIVRTAEGEVDASVQTQLQRASEVVSAMLESVEPAA